MTAQTQQLTPAQQKLMQPKARDASGMFDAAIDGLQVDFQTLTVAHDFDQTIYRIVARHADSSVTVIKITLEFPDTLREGQVIKLENWMSNNVHVWYAVKSPTIHYIVRCTKGTLIIDSLQASVIKVSGTLDGITDEDANGNTHTLEVNFDLTS